VRGKQCKGEQKANSAREAVRWMRCKRGGERGDERDAVEENE
jgi:hypothetical protein